MKTVFTLMLAATVAFSYSQPNSNLKIYQTGKGSRSPEKLLQSLIGDGVVLKNYSISKVVSSESYGFFEDKKARLGLSKGLIMTTGSISSISSVNTSPAMTNATHQNVENRYASYTSTSPETGSADLEKYLDNGQKTYDACIIELDIVPTADTLSFNYVFGSEEYDEFVGSQYNDIFAFFISGKGIIGQKNLAVVPNTNTPVSVNSINHGGNSYNSRPSNSSYYVSNHNGEAGIEYDGLTKLMEIRLPVIAYETYHLKLAIADVSDNAYDSGVLLEGHSIVSYEKTYNVLYENNSADIEKGYKNLLDALAKEYKAHPEVNIKITGHTDADGSDELNNELSCSRAQGVFNYLASKGIDKSRLIMDCKGESQPAYDNTNDKLKILNRRTEIKIMGALNTYTEKKAGEEKLSEEAKLISNYPNPFSDFTTLEFYIPAEVKLANVLISDLTGRTVKTVYLLERGKTTMTFDGTALANGTYAATLIADGKSAGSIKMILQK